MRIDLRPQKLYGFHEDIHASLVLLLQRLSSVLEPVEAGLLVLLDILLGEVGKVEGILIIDDAFEEFMPCDFAIVAESVDEPDCLAVLSHADNGIGDVLNLVKLQVEGTVEPQVARFVPENANADLILEALYGGLVELEELHAEGASAEATRPQLHPKHVSQYQTNEVMRHDLAIYQNVEGDHVGPLAEIFIPVNHYLLAFAFLLQGCVTSFHYLYESVCVAMLTFVDEAIAYLVF